MKALTKNRIYDGGTSSAPYEIVCWEVEEKGPFSLESFLVDNRGLIPFESDDFLDRLRRTQTEEAIAELEETQELLTASRVYLEQLQADKKFEIDLRDFFTSQLLNSINYNLFFVANTMYECEVHYVLGHGRSATLAVALLVAKKLAGNVTEAEAIIKQVRPQIALSKAQRDFLERLG